MFDWFKFKKNVENNNVIPFPEKKEIDTVDMAPHKEYYRVGFTNDGQTTLTLINHEGWGSMTLTMNKEACEQLIRMLRATYIEDDNV
jgi:hypothetical protein